MDEGKTKHTCICPCIPLPSSNLKIASAGGMV